jgi:hypothetical protein
LLFLDCCPVGRVDVGQDEEVISLELPRFEVLSVFFEAELWRKKFEDFNHSYGTIF